MDKLPMRSRATNSMECTATFLARPWSEHLDELARSAEQSLLIVSPFITRQPLMHIASLLRERACPPNTLILTNLGNGYRSGDSLNVAALTEFADEIRSTSVAHLASLHAKAYIADSHAAIITSANLTHYGLTRNLEYGVLFHDKPSVTHLRNEFEAYAAQGSRFPQDSLREIALEAEQLNVARKEAQGSISREIRSKLIKLEQRSKLYKARARGNTTNGILTDAILFLLERHGPLSTVNLHPHVQRLHPDICDDEIDRVIGDVHFGKRWKHYVRNAQQGLRRRGQIELRSDGRWHLLR